MSGQYPNVTSAPPLLSRSVPFEFLYDCHTSLEQYYLFVLFWLQQLNKAYLFYY